MKFTRRHDLDPQTRIDIVKHVWIHQIFALRAPILVTIDAQSTTWLVIPWAAKKRCSQNPSRPTS